jgi:tryptophan synthase beta chain
VRLIGVEAAGHGTETNQHCATLSAGRPGVLHGAMSYLLQNEDGQVSPSHSISAGLDYPGVGPEHAWLKETGRAEYVSITDREALQAFEQFSQLEGIIPALECSHGLAHVAKTAPAMKSDEILLFNLSGRGDKDMDTAARELELSGR